jgi:hypothetical protein
MPDTGAPHSLPWPPSTGVTPDVPRDMQDLAEQVAERLGVRSYAEVNTSQSRNNVTFGDLATAGPSVTITVPTNALVAVFVSMSITPGVGVTGIVDLFEDGADLGSVLSASSSPGTYTTAPGTISTGDAGTGPNIRADAGWITFPAAVGSRTYALKYATTGGSADFATRRLWVRTIPF